MSSMPASKAALKVVVETWERPPPMASVTNPPSTTLELT
jgi:hypothetical protein